MAIDPKTEPPVNPGLQKITAARRWVKRSRYVFMAVVTLLLLYVVVSYKIFTLPGAFDPTLNKIQSPVEGVEKGDMVLLLKLNLWREPKLNDIVIYDHPAPRDGVPEALIGRIAGLPGETITRVGPTLSVGGRDALAVGLGIGPTVKVKDGDVIPEGCYLILSDTDALAYADSRDFGYIEAGKIRSKVSINLSVWFGQRQPRLPESPAGAKP